MNMRTVTGLIGALSLVCGSAVFAGQAKPPAGAKPAAAVAATPESITNGAALYKRQCVMCHGATGVGDGAAAKSFKGKLPSLADKATMSKLTRRADSRSNYRRQEDRDRQHARAW